ncbi:MAG: phage/plasmid primase, P4 family [bacterium]
MSDKLFHNNNDKFDVSALVDELLKHATYINEAATDTLYKYNGSCFVRVHDRAIQQKMMQLCATGTTRHQREEVIDLLKTKTSLDFKFISNHNNCLNIKNGIFDVGKMKIFPRTRGDHPFYVIDLEYEPKALCPKWDSFLIQIFEGDRTLVEILQNMFGYCLLTGNFLQVCFIFAGTGQNGKSVTLDVLRALLGGDNISSLSMTDISEKFRLVEMRYKLANICDESPSKKQIDMDIFKNLVSGGMVTAEEKQKKPVQFKNTAKMIFSCNTTPLMSDSTFAFQRRLTIIPFSYLVKKEEKDPFLTEKLIEELPGIFNWALVGACRILTSKSWDDLFYSEKGEAAKEDFIRDNDSVKAFIDEYCDVKDPKAEVNCSLIYKVYRNYTENNGYTPCSSGQFGKRLKNYFPHITRVRKTTGDRDYYYVGIGLIGGSFSSLTT